MSTASTSSRSIHSERGILESKSALALTRLLIGSTYKKSQDLASSTHSLEKEMDNGRKKSLTFDLGRKVGLPNLRGCGSIEIYELCVGWQLNINESKSKVLLSQRNPRTKPMGHLSSYRHEAR